MSHKVTSGHCLCRATRWEYVGDSTWACYCHCDDCRRNCAAPVVAWLGVPLAQFQWTRQRPKAFESSKGVQRYFCETCGSPMAFEADHYAGEIALYAASMENPEDYEPTFHVFCHEQLPWLKLHDDLSKYPKSLFDAQTQPSL